MALDSASDALSEIRKKLYEKKLESNQKREDINKVFTLFSVILSLIVVEPIRRWFLLERLVDQFPARERKENTKEAESPGIESSASSLDPRSGSPSTSTDGEATPITPAQNDQSQPAAGSAALSSPGTADINQINANHIPEDPQKQSIGVTAVQTDSRKFSGMIQWPNMSRELKAACMYGLGFGLGLGFGVSAVTLGVFAILRGRQ